MRLELMGALIVFASALVVAVIMPSVSRLLNVKCKCLDQGFGRRDEANSMLFKHAVTLGYRMANRIIS